MAYIYQRKGKGFTMQSEELLKKIEGAIKDWPKDVDQCFDNADPVISSIAKRANKIYFQIEVDNENSTIFAR